MARGKQSRKSDLPTQTQSDSLSTGAQIRASELQSNGSKSFKHNFSFLDYAIVCVFFIAFCYLQKFVALTWFGVESVEPSIEGISLQFFFDTMWKGFVIVALLAWLHDFFYKEPEEEDTA